MSLQYLATREAITDAALSLFYHLGSIAAHQMGFPEVALFTILSAFLLRPSDWAA